MMYSAVFCACADQYRGQKVVFLSLRHHQAMHLPTFAIDSMGCCIVCLKSAALVWCVALLPCLRSASAISKDELEKWKKKWNSRKQSCDTMTWVPCGVIKVQPILYKMTLYWPQQSPVNGQKINGVTMWREQPSHSKTQNYKFKESYQHWLHPQLITFGQGPELQYMFPFLVQFEN